MTTLFQAHRGSGASCHSYISRWLRTIGLVLGLGCSSAFGANTYFLQLPNMPGDVTVKGYEHWTAIDTFSWGVYNTGSGNGGGGGGTGKAVFEDLGWTQVTDSSTPKFFVAVATGRVLDKVTLDVLKSTGGASQSFFQMIFEGSMATRLSLTGTGDTPMASAAISSGDRVTLRYRPQLPSGALGSWVEGVFNVRDNSPTITFEGDLDVLTGLFMSGASLNFDASAITVVPEPATAALLLAGLVLLSQRRRA